MEVETEAQLGQPTCLSPCSCWMVKLGGDKLSNQGSWHYLLLSLLVLNPEFPLGSHFFLLRDAPLLKCSTMSNKSKISFKKLNTIFYPGVKTTVNSAKEGEGFLFFLCPHCLSQGLAWSSWINVCWMTVWTCKWVIENSRLTNPWPIHVGSFGQDETL